ncbi:FGGY-family carbohydrate kinase [Pseudooceanicola sp. 502str34]
MDRYVCAVDVGTRSARAAVFTTDGTALSHHVRPIALWEKPGGGGEHASDDIWRAVCAAVRDAVTGARVAPEAICAIGFDATCSLVLHDRDGAPLPLGDEGQDTIAWFDHRAVAQAARCTASGHRVLDHIGGAMSPEMQVPKLMWLKQARPDLWSRLGAARDLTDFLTWRASGSNARSLCTLTAKWTYLAHDGGWQADFLDAMGLEDMRARAALPDLGTPVGAPLGPLTAQAAAELGLSETCQVATGMIDAFAGALGVLGGQPAGSGDLALIAGTSSCIMALTPEPWQAPGIWGPYHEAILPGAWVAEGGQSATGALLDHVLRVFAPEKTPDKATTISAHNRVMAQLTEALEREGAAFARDLHVLPDFNGNRTPLADPLLRGVLSGLSLDTTGHELLRVYWRASVAIALGLRQIIEQMEGAGTPVRRLMITGGHTRSPLLLQLYADVTGREVHLRDAPDGVLLGSAIAAAMAGGLAPDLSTAAQAMQGHCRSLSPDPGRQAIYDRDYAIFRRMQAHRAELAQMN